MLISLNNYDKQVNDYTTNFSRLLAFLVLLELIMQNWLSVVPVKSWSHQLKFDYFKRWWSLNKLQESSEIYSAYCLISIL